MQLTARFILPLIVTGLLMLVGCSKHEPGAQTPALGSNVMNLYFWVDDIAPEAIADFERSTGIKVVLSYYDTNETLDGRMLTGKSGFDVVSPSAPFLQRHIEAGAYLPLDHGQIPNLKYLESSILKRVALNDRGNVHGTIYAWGTYGVTYNQTMVAAAIPGVATDSWSLLFDPTYAAKLAPCGINFIDAPAVITRLVMLYLRKDPNDLSSANLAEVERVLLRIRPYIRTVDSSIDTEALVNGDICIGITYNGTAHQARQRVAEIKNGKQLSFMIPREGSLLWFDMLAIPVDAPHAANAHRFLNYMLEPRVAAMNTMFTGVANAVPEAAKFEEPVISTDPITYPTPATRERLFVQQKDSRETSRAITRLWQKFKTGQ